MHNLCARPERACGHAVEARQGVQGDRGGGDCAEGVQTRQRKRQGAARPTTAGTGEAIVSVVGPEVVEAPEDVSPAIGSEVVIEPVAACPVAEAVPPATEPKPTAVPSAEVAELDQRIAEARKAMNRLASELSVKRIELAGLRGQRASLGPAPRSRRDPDAPRRTTLLDDASEPMQAKAIWQSIVKQSLWATPNGGPPPTPPCPPPCCAK